MAASQHRRPSTVGSLLDLQGLSADGARRLRVLTQSVDRSYSEVQCEAIALLEVEDFAWPSFVAWRAYFEQCEKWPASWPDSLRVAAPIPPVEALRRYRSMRRALSDRARALLAVGRHGIRQSELRTRLNWSEADMATGIKDLTAAGIAARWLTGADLVAVLGMDDLRALQKALGLKGARTKDALRIIISDGASATEIARHVPGEPHLDLPRLADPELDAWRAYVSDVALVLALTIAAEQHSDQTRNQCVQSGSRSVKACGAGDELSHPVCRAVDGKRVPAADGSIPPFFPGCRCVALPHFEDAVDAQAPRTRAARRGCLIMLAPMIAVASAALWVMWLRIAG